jgi:hypothetical protein
MMKKLNSLKDKLYGKAEEPKKVAETPKLKTIKKKDGKKR